MNLPELSQKLKQLLEMSPNLKKDQTNLPAIIYVSQEQGNHSARIKFQNQKSDKIHNDKWIPMTIEDSPKIIGNQKLTLSNKEIDKIKLWIAQNKEALLDFWYLKISLDELNTKLTKLS